MPLQEFTSRKAVQLLATQSRRADLSSIELCKLHVEMGTYLAYQMLEEFDLQETQIQHVQGIKTGVELADGHNIAVCALMRAGLYAAEGIRNVVRDAQFFLLHGEEIPTEDLKGKTVIVADAVINTGRSIEKIIEQLQPDVARRIIVATLVMQKEATSLAEKYPDVSFYALRVSENKYVGKGGTDTGNRLFNTIH